MVDRISSMKWMLPASAVLMGWVSAALSAAPVPLTSLRAVHALTNAEASRTLPVEFQPTVVYVRAYENLLFVQDEDIAIFIRRPAGAERVPGDRVLLRGTTAESFRPYVFAHDVTLLHHGAPPTPIPATFECLIRAHSGCRLVS